jgi:hypothetical protein
VMLGDVRVTETSAWEKAYWFLLFLYPTSLLSRGKA